MSYCAVNIASFRFSGPNARLDLSKALLDGAKESATAIRRAADIVNRSSQSPENFDKAVSFLAFKSRTTPQNHFDSLGKSVYDICTPLSHCEAATLAEIQAYRDAADLCFMGGSNNLNPATIAGSIDTENTIISKYHLDHPVHDDGNAPQFLWMPRTIDAFKRGVAQVHKQWYLLHHVVMVVHTLASTVDWTPNEKEQPFYSLEKLCSMIEFDTKIAEAAMSRWSKKPVSSAVRRSPVKARKSVKARPGVSVKTARQFCIDTKNKTPSPTPRSSPVESIEQRTVKDGPDEKFPGWNVRIIRRATGDHADHYWYMPEHPNIVVRSKIGVDHIRQIMRRDNMEFVDACKYLSEVEGKKIYFKEGRGNIRRSPQKTPASNEESPENTAMPKENTLNNPVLLPPALMRTTETATSATVKKCSTFPKSTVDYLNKWLDDHKIHPFPSNEERLTIMASTGLNKRQLSVWLSRARKKHRHQTDITSNNSVHGNTAIPPHMDVSLALVNDPVFQLNGVVPSVNQNSIVKRNIASAHQKATTQVIIPGAPKSNALLKASAASSQNKSSVGLTEEEKVYLRYLSCNATSVPATGPNNITSESAAQEHGERSTQLNQSTVAPQLNPGR